MPDDSNNNNDPDEQKRHEHAELQPEKPATSVGLLGPGIQPSYTSSALANPQLSDGGPQDPPSYPLSLLGDPRLNGRGNGPVRTALMLQMQQTYGNRAVQRWIASHRQGQGQSVQSTSLTSIQRGPDSGVGTASSGPPKGSKQCSKDTPGTFYEKAKSALHNNDYKDCYCVLNGLSMDDMVDTLKMLGGIQMGDLVDKIHLAEKWEVQRVLDGIVHAFVGLSDQNGALQVIIKTNKFDTTKLSTLSPYDYNLPATAVFVTDKTTKTVKFGPAVFKRSYEDMVKNIGDALKGEKQEDMYYYERGNFSGYYDGEVLPTAGEIRLRMRLKFETAGGGWLDPVTGGPSARAEELRRSELSNFQSKFKEVVEKAWSDKYKLKPACKIDGSLEYHAYVQIDIVEDNPHATVKLYRSFPGARSEAKAGKEANLLPQDNTQKAETKAFKGEPQVYYQIASAHEFGHLLGLHHVRADRGNDDELQYGITPEEMKNIMGRGMDISIANYEPFKSIAVHYGKDTKPPCTNWTITK